MKFISIQLGCHYEGGWGRVKNTVSTFNYKDYR